jgi:UDP-glucose 4-epimerase
MALYVVTGGAGFIGSHLVDALLAAGHAVRVVDDLSTGRRENLHRDAKLTVGDIADPNVARTALRGSDGCFHLAAIASVMRANQDWLGCHRTNLTGTIGVLDAARHAGRMPVVYASSAAIYGDQGPGLISEDAAPHPTSAYGADKLGCELHARVAYGVHGVPTLGFRFFNVYGPRQDPTSPYSGVISIFASRIAGGLPVGIDGDGEQTRDFIFVADVVRHLIAGMDSLHATPAARVLNACTGRAISVNQLAQTLAEVAGQAARIVHGSARPGDIRCSLGNPQAAQTALGVIAAVSLADGLSATLASLRGAALALVA